MFRQIEPSVVHWIVIKPVLLWTLVQMTVFLLTECITFDQYLTLARSCYALYSRVSARFVPTTVDAGIMGFGAVTPLFDGPILA